MDIKSGRGRVIKPPVAVNLTTVAGLEEEITLTLNEMGLNVFPVVKQTYVEIVNSLRSTPEILEQFERYCAMTPEYDSEKWRAKHGGSRKFAFYECTDYVDGYNLSNPLLLADMKRDPDSYKQAIRDLRALWETEKQLVLGDRRADQYIVTNAKRAYGIDYQFMGDKDRWARTKDAIPEHLEGIPELLAEFKKPIKKSLLSKITGGRV